MSRSVLETVFASLVDKWGTEAQFAHRHLDTLSDNDLRRMIQTMENRSTKE